MSTYGASTGTIARAWRTIISAKLTKEKADELVRQNKQRQNNQSKNPQLQKSSLAHLASRLQELLKERAALHQVGSELRRTHNDMRTAENDVQSLMNRVAGLEPLRHCVRAALELVNAYVRTSSTLDVQGLQHLQRWLTRPLEPSLLESSASQSLASLQALMEDYSGRNVWTLAEVVESLRRARAIHTTLKAEVEQLQNLLDWVVPAIPGINIDQDTISAGLANLLTEPSSGSSSTGIQNLTSAASAWRIASVPKNASQNSPRDGQILCRIWLSVCLGCDLACTLLLVEQAIDSDPEPSTLNLLRTATETMAKNASSADFATPNGQLTVFTSLRCIELLVRLGAEPTEALSFLCRTIECLDPQNIDNAIIAGLIEWLELVLQQPSSERTLIDILEKSMFWKTVEVTSNGRTLVSSAHGIAVTNKTTRMISVYSWAELDWNNISRRSVLVFKSTRWLGDACGTEENFILDMGPETVWWAAEKFEDQVRARFAEVMLSHKRTTPESSETPKTAKHLRDRS